MQTDPAKSEVNIAPDHVWRREKTKTLKKRLLPATKGYKDILLHRFNTAIVKFPPISTGDTLRVYGNNKSGMPLKWIQLKLGQQTPLELRDTATFYCETVATSADAPVLYLKQRLTPQRQTVSVRLERIPRAQYDTVYVNQDVMVKYEQSKVGDSIFRQSITPLGGKDLLTYWKGSIPTNRDDEIIRRTTTLRIDTNPPIRVVVQPARIVRMRNWEKTDLTLNKGFINGDTLVFSVTAQGNSRMHKCELLDQDSTILHSVRDISALSDTTVVDGETTFKLSLYAKPSWRKKYARVTILRIRPVAPDSFLLVTDSLFQLIETVLYDTLVLQLFDDSLELTPIWDIEQEPFGEFRVQFPESVPKMGNLSYAAYWLGIGQPALDEFNRLEAAVPPEWSRPGVSAALGALGFGRRLAFLEPYPTDVVIGCVSAKKSDRAKSGKSPGPTSEIKNRTYGRLEYSSLMQGTSQVTDSKTGIKNRTFYLCFQNKSTVSPFPVAFKLVGFYLQKKSEAKIEKWLKTEIRKEPLRS